MNRQIKFRAWDKEKGYMVDPCAGYLIEFDGDCWYNLGTEDLKDNLLNQTEILVLMQFTGLKDCNGVEIYEGDIVQSQHTMPSIVQWHEEYASFQFGVGCDLSEYSYIYPDDAWEIIGNIHENPELLRLIED